MYSFVFPDEEEEVTLMYAQHEVSNVMISQHFEWKKTLSKNDIICDCNSHKRCTLSRWYVKPKLQYYANCLVRYNRPLQENFP